MNGDGEALVDALKVKSGNIGGRAIVVDISPGDDWFRSLGITISGEVF